MKRMLVTALLASAILLALLPAAAAAETDTIVDASEISYFELPVIDPRFPSSSAIDNSEDDPNAVPLADKRAVRFIDRFKLPQFAVSLYNTLVSESKPAETSGLGRDGWLVDPSRAPFVFTFSDGDNYVAPFPYPTAAELRSAGFQFTNLTEFVNNCVSTAYYSFKRDHPEAVWLRGYGYYNDTSDHTFYLSLAKVGFPEGEWEIRAEGYRNPEIIRSTLSALNRSIESIVSEAGRTSSNYEKILYFNEWLTTNNQYNYNVAYGKNEFNGDIYEAHCALTTKDNQPGGGRSGVDGPVCASYATAFQLLCQRANIPCVTVEGPDHMWNYVQPDPSDPRWYAMDVTWNDPIMSGMPTLAEYLSWGGREDTAYTLVGGDTIVYDGKAETFLDQHPRENMLIVGDAVYANFSMGPELNPTAYVDRVVIGDLDAPAEGAVPDTSVTLTSEPKNSHPLSQPSAEEMFTAPAVTWSPALVNGRFAAGTAYTATISYATRRQGYGLTSADAPKITVPGAESVSVGADGTIRAVFPKLGGDAGDDGALHGRILVSVGGDSSQGSEAYAARNEMIILHVTPDPGYRLSSIQVIRADNGQSVSVSGGGDRYTFAMPDSDVSVQAAFTRT